MIFRLSRLVGIWIRSLEGEQQTSTCRWVIKRQQTSTMSWWVNKQCFISQSKPSNFPPFESLVRVPTPAFLQRPRPLGEVQILISKNGSNQLEKCGLVQNKSSTRNLKHEKDIKRHVFQANWTVSTDRRSCFLDKWHNIFYKWLKQRSYVPKLIVHLGGVQEANELMKHLGDWQKIQQIERKNTE